MLVCVAMNEGNMRSEMEALQRQTGAAKKAKSPPGSPKKVWVFLFCPALSVQILKYKNSGMAQYQRRKGQLETVRFDCCSALKGNEKQISG